MTDLADFLLARITDDEVDAQTSLAGHQPGEPWGYAHLPGDGPHIARWNPSRVLTDCASKRRLIDELTNPDFPSFRMMQSVADQLLKIMACPYADHPDFHEEWRP